MNGRGLAGWLGGLVALTIVVLWLVGPWQWAAAGSVVLVIVFAIVVRQLLD